MNKKQIIDKLSTIYISMQVESLADVKIDAEDSWAEEKRLLQEVIDFINELPDNPISKEAKLTLQDKAWELEKEHLLENYESPGYDIVDYEPDYHPLMKKYAKTHLVPSRNFIKIFSDRVCQLIKEEKYNTGRDQDDYNNWADAGGVDDGEDFVSDLDIWEWDEYYENN